MNLDELQSVQSRERQIDSLQQLQDTFYEDAGRFIRQLREEREHVAAEAVDPFDSTDVQRLTDEINTAEQTVEAIYERRIGKLVKQASLDAAGMAADVEGLTREEQSAFDSLVSTIEANRTRVLDEVLGNTPSERGSDTTDEAAHDDEHAATTDRSSPPERESAPVAPDETDAKASPDSDAGNGGATNDDGNAAPAAGHHVPEMTAEDTGDVPVHAQPDADAPDELAENGSTPVAENGSTPVAENGSTPVAENGSTPDPQNVDRVTVRITRDVGEILCVDDRAYELSTDDIVTLPEPNAQPLINHDAATRLEQT